MSQLYLGDYYFQYDCPHCKHVTPIVKKIQAHLVDAYFGLVPAVPKWQDPRREKMAQRFDQGEWYKQTERYEGLHGTPVFFWRDGVEDEKLAFDGKDRLVVEEAREYLCRRVARLYLRNRIPRYNWPDDGVDPYVDSVFEGEWARTKTPSGETYAPYHALYELTSRYAHL